MQLERKISQVCVQLLGTRFWMMYWQARLSNMMDGKCTNCCYSLDTYVILEFHMDLGINPFTYIMQVGSTCEYDIHRSRWDHGE